jgi:hypothetical protein
VVIELIGRSEGGVNQLPNELHQGLMLRTSIALREKDADLYLRRFSTRRLIRLMGDDNLAVAAPA